MAVSGELRSRIADRIKALLGAKGLSSEELATRTALKPKRINHILSGRFIRLTANELTLIADVLGTPVYCLLVPVEPTVEVVSLEVVEQCRSGHA